MPTLTSYNPWDNAPVTEVPVATEQSIADALAAARLALRDWSADYEARKQLILRVADLLKQHRSELATLISRETGKVLWESQAEVDAMVNKCALSIRAQEQRRTPITNGPLATTYRPHGVALVLGPFNFPGHLPWGHICPALLAGNTILFKPSEKAPGVAEMLAFLLKQAELPQGVFQVLHGAGDVATHLLDSDIDAVLFTGSYNVGTKILQRLATRPGVLTALEMGGNNPLIAWDVTNLQAAQVAILQSAFATAGQRCSCARRLIVKHNDPLIEALLAAAQKLTLGKYDDQPAPFYSCLISARAADVLLAAQDRLLAAGYRSILSSTRSDRSPSLLSPGLLLAP
jgi:succinylglutamic semialdehyde dehydrogenase